MKTKQIYTNPIKPLPLFVNETIDQYINRIGGKNYTNTYDQYLNNRDD